MSDPKPFQDATVAAAIASFSRSSSRRRFLVADEVGLGKTVVAKEVARRMSNDGTRPFTIYYVANGHAVSFQNKARVVAFLNEAQRKVAIATPDRLSMIARSKRPAQPVLIYALTPQTSFPGSKVRLTGGKKEERAFIYVLLRHAYPAFARQLGAGTLKLNVGDSWDGLLKDADKKFAEAPPNLTKRFREALAIEFGDDVRFGLEKALYGDSSKDKEQPKVGAFVGRLRRALGLATLRHQPPDLVILDEFQRYRHLLDDDDADPLLQALLKPAGGARPPAILLLSATPYRLLSTRWEESQGTLAHTQLMDLIGFLDGPSTREHATVLFSKFGDKLRDIVAHVETNHPNLDREIDDAAQLRDELRRILTPVMSRTERENNASTDALSTTTYLDAQQIPEDFQLYRHLVDSFSVKDKHDALPYWSSIPLPIQSLGPRYAAGKRAQVRAEKGLPQMTLAKRNGLIAPAAWPDAKLRALNKIAPPSVLSLPWSAPSLPWWSLSGGWKSNAGDPKILMFSRFRATPSSVTALMSFGVEAHCLSKKRGGYEKTYRRRRFKLAAKPGPVMAAFHPAPWLIRHTDPLVKAGKKMSAIREAISQQILSNLPEVAVLSATDKGRKRHRSVAVTIAAIEKLGGSSDQTAAAWATATGDDKAARSAIQKWRSTPKLKDISPLELGDLVDYAISAPGVVLGRALFRHDPTILDANRFSELVQLSWQGFRLYLDNPVILAPLPGKNAVEQVMRAAVDGGLESVLDEHFWLRTQNLPEGAAELAKDLRSALGLRAGSFSFRSVGPGSNKIPVRCHVAVPFGDAEAEPASKRVGENALSAPARPDEVRRAFNTPFWPHVLATTSVGQEGLDFHPWCSRVVHWDLSSNPLDLEQREGRVQRYAGLAVRRQLAVVLRKEWIGEKKRSGSPWQRLQQLADQFGDDSGLKPWWVFDQAEIRRYVFERPFGRDMARFAQLRQQRMIYRLALGQPNQEDFIDVLSRGGSATNDVLRPLVLNLSAMGPK